MKKTKKVEIDDVKRLNRGEYLINNVVKLHNIRVSEEGEMNVSIDFDENEIDEIYAHALVNEFVSRAVNKDS